MAPWLSMVMDGARGPSSAAVWLQLDLRILGWLPEGRLKLTWFTLDELLRVTRCSVCFGI